jgi:hypothetical protein
MPPTGFHVVSNGLVLSPHPVGHVVDKVNILAVHFGGVEAVVVLGIPPRWLAVARDDHIIPHRRFELNEEVGVDVAGFGGSRPLEIELNSVISTLAEILWRGTRERERCSEPWGWGKGWIGDGGE